ncbi:MAG: methionine--tRNA ligase [Desulfobacterales bacterium]|nr:methionine--tRNA ligase [Desulfobacterales bacterium]
MKPNPFFITTPIYYVNARPHLGHAYTTIVADVVTRYHSMKGTETFFLTGTDEHGDKIIKAAKKENMSPRVYVDMISGLFKNLWPEIDIEYNYFVRTTDLEHIKIVEQILQKIYDKGDIYFSEYEGRYCFGCERFYTDKELVDGKCPDHKTEPELIKEANYFFKMSKYQDWLIDHIKSNPGFIRPERYANEVLGFLSEPLEDLCISRPKSRLKWGISLPFDDNYVTYVWFDALLNYISALSYPNGDLFNKFWPYSQHLIAKDILKPHGIYWPIILKSAEIPIFKNLNVHGYWNVEQNKMSKSLGNVIDPLQLKNIYGLDAFRYFLMREMAFGLDSNFSEESLINRINSDLANDLGNLFSRVLAMSHKYFKGVVPDVTPDIEKELQLDLENQTVKTISEFKDAMENFAFHKALIAVWELISYMNKYVDITAPWTLASQKSAQKQLESVIYNLLEGLRNISILLYPFMPSTSKKMQKHLGIEPTSDYFLLNNIKNKEQKLKAGTVLPKSVSLFPRVESAKNDESETSMTHQKAPEIPIKPEITIEDFSKIDLRVGTIISVENIPRAKKLLKIEVDAGDVRTIVSGIAEHYDAQSLIGKQIIIIANLKPTKLMGVLSNGMLLAATDDSGLSIATLDKKIKNGVPLK